MAEKGGQTIVIKKGKGGHAAAHGGAWKVAYADFVTAMMAFFLVMWLMGSDEETKSAVASYFNNPTSAWRLDIVNNNNQPLGDRTGEGDQIVTGSEGQVPEQLVKDPSVAVPPEPQAAETEVAPETKVSDVVRKLPMRVDAMTFSIPEKEVFRPGTDEITAHGEKVLQEVGQLFRSQRGRLTIEAPSYPGQSFDFRLSRAVATSRYLVRGKFVNEEQVNAKTVPALTGQSDGGENTFELRFVFRHRSE